MMSHTRSPYSFVLALLLSISLSATFVSELQAAEIIHYENKPVSVTLQQGTERSIIFGDHIQVGLTKLQKATGLFRVQSAQGVLHILPRRAFDKQRIQVKRMTDGRVILLDLISIDKKDGTVSNEDVRIFTAEENAVERAATPTQNRAPVGMPYSNGPISPVDLTRFASQQLYGPERLHRNVPGISRASLTVKSAIKVFKGKNKYRTISKPMAAYTGGSHTLTAIYIQNLESTPVGLDYMDLNVPFTHATFQHHQLNAKGMPGDTTVLYLVTKGNLAESLQPWSYYQDLRSGLEASVKKEERSKRESRYDDAVYR